MAAASSSATQDDSLKYLNAPQDMRFCRGVLGDRVALFNEQAQTHLASQATNPFSGHAAGGQPHLSIKDANYGRPVEGSKTDLRGKKAMAHVAKEILELCEIIDQCGHELPMCEDRKYISFGELFNIYTCINDKLVGLLLRARKYHLVDFEGECLFQRRDDDVPVLLLKKIQDIRLSFKNGDALSQGTKCYAAVSAR